MNINLKTIAAIAAVTGIATVATVAYSKCKSKAKSKLHIPIEFEVGLGMPDVTIARSQVFTFDTNNACLNVNPNFYEMMDNDPEISESHALSIGTALISILEKINAELAKVKHSAQLQTKVLESVDHVVFSGDCKCSLQFIKTV